MRYLDCLFWIVLCILHPALLPAKSEDKRTIDPEAYAQWTNLVVPLLSDNGRWAAYTLSSASGAQELVVRSTRGTKEFRVARGVLPREESEDTFESVEAILRPTKFTADSRHVLFGISRIADSMSQVAEGTAHTEGSVLDGLGILRLSDGVAKIIPDVASYSTPKDSGRYLAYTLETGAGGSSDAQAITARTHHHEVGKPLVLRDLLTGSEVQIAGVTVFSFDDTGQYLTYALASEQTKKSGIYLRRLSDGHVTTLLKRAGCYRRLTFDSRGVQLAFLSEKEEQDALATRFSIYYVASPFAVAQPVVEADALKDGLMIDTMAPVKFTAGGGGLIFSLTSMPMHPPRISAELPAQQANFDLWHWKDPGGMSGKEREWRRIPSLRKLRQSYLALYHLKEGRVVQLGRAGIPRALLSADGRFAVGIDDTAYRLQSTWGSSKSDSVFDLYLIDVTSGAATIFRRGVSAQGRVQSDLLLSHFSFSPTGKYLMYFEDERWWSANLVTRKVLDLTGALLPTVRFEHSSMTKYPSGIAGWTAADEHVLLHSWNDIWQIDPAGISPPRNLTDGVGQRENIVFRLWTDNYWHSEYDLSTAEWFVDTAGPLLLWALDQDTMATGIWRDWIGVSKAPEPLLVMEKRIVPVAKANRTRQYLFTMETFSEYPDLWTASRVDQLKKISSANPQQSRYGWGSVEVMEFNSELGVPLRGLLYKPDEFDPSRKYPMVVNVYGNYSFDLHRYPHPMPGEIPPASRFTSEGFLYFRPDVEYRASAKKARSITAAVVPAVRTIVDRGIVDPTRIGLLGFSFGGYEVSAIVAETSLFRCAVNAAGPVDPISYYGAVQGYGHRYTEAGQWSHGGSIWERPFIYIANSSLMYADRVQTPVLQRYNDFDAAIPASQGFAFYFALQRNGKQVWLIRYPGEGHVLSRYANRVDWEERVMEFFEYHLNDIPHPSWMQSAVVLQH